MNDTANDAPPRRRPGRPRKVDSGDTKGELIRAAVRLFAQRGFEGTSIRALAREVGLSESVLYAHFENKQAVFDAVMARFGPQDSDDIFGSVDADLAVIDPPRFLSETVSKLLEDWDREEARLMISLMTRDGHLHSHELRSALTRMRGYATELFANWITSKWIPERFGPADRLALSFSGPIGLARVLHLHADASSEERAKARADVLQHVELFTMAVFHTN